MDSHQWCRPSDLEYPKVWSQFTKTNCNGETIEFQIQDLPETLFSKCLDFMVKYFIADDPLFNCLGFAADSTSVSNLLSCWRKALLDKCTLVCTLKNCDSNETDIVGAYILYYHHKVQDCDNDHNGRSYRALSDIVTYMEKQNDRYQQFCIDDYLDEFGICVHPKYRGLGIATELVKARNLLGEALGLKYSFTLCTGIASQKACEKIGYKDLVEIKYKTLQEVFPHLNINVKGTPSLRYMYIQHNC